MPKSQGEALRECPNPWCEFAPGKKAWHPENPKAWPFYVYSANDEGTLTYRGECKCGVKGPHFSTEAEAIAAWNTRPQPPSSAVPDARMVEAIKEMLPIVEAAFWDEHTAGMLPGRGYNNKAQHLAGQKWGWKDSVKYSKWCDAIKAALTPSGVTRAEAGGEEDRLKILERFTDKVLVAHKDINTDKRTGLPFEDGYVMFPAVEQAIRELEADLNHLQYSLPTAPAPAAVEGGELDPEGWHIAKTLSENSVIVEGGVCLPVVSKVFAEAMLRCLQHSATPSPTSEAGDRLAEAVSNFLNTPDLPTPSGERQTRSVISHMKQALAAYRSAKEKGL